VEGCYREGEALEEDDLEEAQARWARVRDEQEARGEVRGGTADMA
jgi:hypothetical protein